MYLKVITILEVRGQYIIMVKVKLPNLNPQCGQLVYSRRIPTYLLSGLILALLLLTIMFKSHFKMIYHTHAIINRS